MKTYKHSDGKTYQLVAAPIDENHWCHTCDLNPNDEPFKCDSCDVATSQHGKLRFKICSSVNNSGTDMILKEIKMQQHIRQNMITIVAGDAVYKIDKDLEIESTYAVYKGDDFGGAFSSFESAFNLVQELLKLHDEKASLFYTQKWLEEKQLNSKSHENNNQ